MYRTVPKPCYVFLKTKSLLLIIRYTYCFVCIRIDSFRSDRSHAPAKNVLLLFTSADQWFCFSWNIINSRRKLFLSLSTKTCSGSKYSQYYLFSFQNRRTGAGIIIGLAIYNCHILDFTFPVAIYKKLLGLPVGLHDLKDVNGEVYNSLVKLLEYPEDRVEADMGLTYQVCCNQW